MSAKLQPKVPHLDRARNRKEERRYMANMRSIDLPGPKDFDRIYCFGLNERRAKKALRKLKSCRPLGTAELRYCLTYEEELYFEWKRKVHAKHYTVYWLDGKRTVLSGLDIADAFRSAGYGCGALGAVDFYSSGECNEYMWDSTQREWVAA